MAEFKIERKPITIDIYGTDYKCTKPTFKQVVDMQDKIEELDGKAKLNYIKDVIVSVGIPGEVVDDMQSESVLELLEIITGAKKN